MLKEITRGAAHAEDQRSMGSWHCPFDTSGSRWRHCHLSSEAEPQELRFKVPIYKVAVPRGPKIVPRSTAMQRRGWPLYMALP